jgi:hypothetical protein
VFVFNGAMRRFWTVPAAACLLAALAPAAASAQIIEVGATTSPLVAPVCPPNLTASQCTIVLPEVTAFESVRDGVAYPTRITKPGDVVGFSLGVSSLTSNTTKAKSEISFLNGLYGGGPTAQLSVLRHLGRGSSTDWRVVGQSAVFQLLPYLGQVVEFPLVQPLPVVPGEVLAVTVPTWAPILTINVTPSQFGYRQSRRAKCTVPPASSAQTLVGNRAGYRCSYTGTRVEYSATEITTPLTTP